MRTEEFVRLFWYILFVCLNVSSIKAQNALFSQYYYPTPVFSNPAWVAARQEVFVGLNFRRQQIGVRQSISTSGFQLALPIIDQNYRRAGGLGLALLNETAGKGGLLRTNAVLGNLAYNVDFSDYDHLAFGMQGGYFFRRLDPNLLTTESQYTINGFDANLPINENFATFRSDFPIINAGLLWYGEDDNQNLLYHLGGFGYTLNRPNTNWFAEVSKIPWMLGASGEFLLYEKDSWTFHPTFRYVEQGRRRNVRLGSMFRYQIDKKSLLHLATWYDLNKVAVMSVDFAKENYHIAFSYDFAFGNRNVLGQTNSALEISLVWKKPLDFTQKRPKKRPFVSPPKKPKDTTKKIENVARIDTTKKEIGEANRVEKVGGMRVIIREPLEIIAPKKKINLTEADKRLLQNILIPRDEIRIETDKIYQIAQILMKDENWKLKIVLYTQKNHQHQFLLESQADDIRRELILQGIDPERIIRQNITKNGEKNRLEWVILRK